MDNDMLREELVDANKRIEQLKETIATRDDQIELYKGMVERRMRMIHELSDRIVELEIK